MHICPRNTQSDVHIVLLVVLPLSGLKTSGLRLFGISSVPTKKTKQAFIPPVLTFTGVPVKLERD